MKPNNINSLFLSSTFEFFCATFVMQPLILKQIYLIISIRSRQLMIFALEINENIRHICQHKITKNKNKRIIYIDVYIASLHACTVCERYNSCCQRTRIILSELKTQRERIKITHKYKIIKYIIRNLVPYEQRDRYGCQVLGRSKIVNITSTFLKHNGLNPRLYKSSFKYMKHIDGVITSNISSLFQSSSQL